MRGVGQGDPLWGFEPGVGIYVDDVYYARPQGAILDVFNVVASRFCAARKAHFMAATRRAARSNS